MAAASGNRPAVRAAEDRWHRLGELLEQRRADLGYGGRQRARFAREHGVSVRRINDIETAGRKKPGSWTIGTLKEIASLYGVTYESMTAVLRGDAGELAPEQAAAPPVPVTHLPPVAGAERRGSDYRYFTRIERRLRELAGQGITSPSGAQVFPSSPDDARTWDGIGARLDMDDRAWLIADLQRRADGRDNGAGTGDQGEV